MTYHGRAGVGLVLVWAVLPAARADTFSFVVPTPITVTSGSPISVDVTGQPAVTNALGFTLSGDWSAGAGPPWSTEFRVSLTAPGGAPSFPTSVGGYQNSASVTFPDGPSNGATFNFGAVPQSYAAGTYRVTFDTSEPGTTANLSVSVVTVYSNPTSVTGTTAGQPTFARPLVDGSAVSSTQTTNAIPYTVTQMTVSQSGRYLMTAATPPAYDGFLILYRNSFDPANPLTNFVNAGDPNGPALPNTLSADLTAGTTYFLVTTGFQNTDFGTYNLLAAGPGTVTLTPVPEPSWAVAVGLVLVAGRFVRRRAGPTHRAA